jgi:hypothetical protein
MKHDGGGIRFTTGRYAGWLGTGIAPSGPRFKPPPGSGPGARRRRRLRGGPGAVSDANKTLAELAQAAPPSTKAGSSATSAASGRNDRAILKEVAGQTSTASGVTWGGGRGVGIFGGNRPVRSCY